MGADMPLKFGEDRPYEMVDKEVWINVGSISIIITRTDEGVVVDLYARDIIDEALVSTWLTFHEAQCVMDEEEEKLEALEGRD